jgi:hypothetical protein
MRCTLETWGDEDVPVTPESPNDGSFLAYLNGVVESRLTTIVTDDLHPFIQDPAAFWYSLPIGNTVSERVSDIAPLAEHFEQIARYVAGADNGGTGPVFETPQEITGRSAISVSTADAKLLAAGYLMSAAGIYMVESYESALRFVALDDMTDEEMAEEINSTLPALHHKTDADFKSPSVCETR